MPDPGVYIEIGETFDVPGYNPAVMSRTTSIGALGLQHVVPEFSPFLGPRTSTQPVEIRNVPHPGVLQLSYFHDYYNRLYILPERLDFGAINGTVSGELIVWNAWFAPTTITAITLVNLPGVDIEGPALPTVYKPLELVSYTVTVSGEGEPVVSGDIVFDVDNPTVPPFTAPVELAAVRAYVSPFRPNWKQGVRASYEFRTEIQTSRSGREKRYALRETPRLEIEYTAINHGRSLRKMNEILNVAQARAMVMPDYTKSVRAPDGVLANSAVFIADSIPYWLTVGMDVMMAQHEREETRKIESITGNLILLNASSPQEWGPGVKLHPQIAGVFADSMASNRRTNSVTELPISFEIEPGSEAYVDPGYPVSVFKNKLVFLKKPNWASAPQVTYEYPRELVDYGRGVLARYLPRDFPVRLWRGTYLGRKWAEVDEMMWHFFRMKGMQGEFYMPTWEPDIVPRDRMPINTTNIRMVGTEAAQAWTGSTVFQAYAVFLRSGAVIFNKVSLITVIRDERGADTLISGTEKWPYDIELADILRVSWMPTWRFATDKMIVDWLTDQVAQLQLTMMTVEDLA